VFDGTGEGVATRHALAAYAGVLIGALGWLMMTPRHTSSATRITAAALCAGGGLWLSAVLPGGIGPAYVVAAAAVGAMTLPGRPVAALTGIGAVLLTVVLAVRGITWSTITSWIGAMVVVLLVRLVRRQRDERIEHQLLLAEERARAETLAERTHLAREIHDVLAHSLSALSVQLETAAALLERDRPGEAAVIVDKAGQLARDGLTEARQAVGTLRGDPITLPELVERLAAGYREDFAAGADLTVEGERRDLPPEAGLALFRAAQEALSNVRKHAPGGSVRMRLAYEADAVSLDVRNGAASTAPISSLSSGYGLIGLCERAELAGGTAHVGPDGDGWRVDVRIPA
jgi:signal transduction histidine kinase